MTLPRFLKVGKTWFVTRRCLVRKFLLRPDRETTRLLDYAIGHAARRSGVRVIAAVALSNHVHFVIHDPCANMPVFMREFCSLVARALNARLGRPAGPVWGPGSYSKVRLQTVGDVVDKVAYLLANPVRAGLVATPAEWPGLITLVDALGGGVRRAERPTYFFRSEGPDGSAAPAGPGPGDHRPGRWSKVPLPGVEQYELEVPPGFDRADDFRRQVAAALEERLARVRAERARDGKRHYLGRAAILLQDREATPASTEERFRLNPRLACRDWTRRAQACDGWIQFQQQYRAARLAYAAGDHDVEFPDGTYWMRVHLDVRCAAAAG
jgi:putative transposase